MEKRIDIQGMTCEKCVKRVKKIIEKHEGVSDVNVSMEEKEAVLSCSPDGNIADIVKAINDFGYTAAEKE